MTATNDKARGQAGQGAQQEQRNAKHTTDLATVNALAGDICVERESVTGGYFQNLKAGTRNDAVSVTANLPDNIRRVNDNAHVATVTDEFHRISTKFSRNAGPRSRAICAKCKCPLDTIYRIRRDHPSREPINECHACVTSRAEANWRRHIVDSERTISQYPNADWPQRAYEVHRQQYEAASVAGWIETIAEHQCGNPTCRRPIVYLRSSWNAFGSHFHLWRHYCDDECRRLAHPSTRPKRAIVACASCGVEFAQRRADAKFCSYACRQKAYRQRHARIEATP